MYKLRFSLKSDIKPVIFFSALVFSIIISLAVIGYNYLTFRNFLMMDAAIRSGRMSLRAQSQNLERNIYKLEHRMILDVASNCPEVFSEQDLIDYNQKYLITSNLCVYKNNEMLCSDKEMSNWFKKYLEKSDLADLTPLTLYHFDGYKEKDEPFQAGAVLIQKNVSEKYPLILLYTLNLDYINDVLMPASIDTVNPFLAGSEFVLSEPLSEGDKSDADKVYIEYGFHDILPFWMVSSYINATGMKNRAKMEMVIYLGFITLLALMAFASSYFIWKQIRQEHELSKVKSQMMSHVSHELKTPLSLIRMYSETLMLGRVSETKSLNYYQTILSECDRLHLLINNVLDISSIEKEMKEYNYTKGDIAAVVSEMALSYEAYIKGHGFEFDTYISSDLPEFFFDRQAVIQIVGNLLDNAMKFSPYEKYISVELDKFPSWIRLRVTDRGIGMRAEDLDNIFKPYQRLSERYRGSGLGLSLVKHSVEAHLGTISVSSSPGEGSVFTVILPICEEDRDVV